MDEGSSQAFILEGIFFVDEKIFQVRQDSFSWFIAYVKYGLTQKMGTACLRVFAVERKYLHG